MIVRQQPFVHVKRLGRPQSEATVQRFCGAQLWLGHSEPSQKIGEQPAFVSQLARHCELPLHTFWHALVRAAPVKSQRKTKLPPDVPMTSFGRAVLSPRGFGVVTVHVTCTRLFAGSR